MMLYNLLASDEQILLDWLPLGYSWAFKVTCLSLLALALLTIILPLQYLSVIPSLCFAVVVVSALLAAFALLQASFTIHHGSFLLMMSIVSMGHHFVWSNIFTTTGIKVMYYPFDLILSVVCLVAV